MACRGQRRCPLPTPLTVRAAHVDDDLQGHLLGCQQGGRLPQLLFAPLDKETHTDTQTVSQESSQTMTVCTVISQAYD